MARGDRDGARGFAGGGRGRREKRRSLPWNPSQLGIETRRGWAVMKL